jgi:Family of unknown function (DUF6527)
MKAKLVQGGRLGFSCPGCDGQHVVFIEGPHAWGFNGSIESPTLTPSILVRGHCGQKNQNGVCHSYITDGRIRFLGDCTHALAGQTVSLPELP